MRYLKTEKCIICGNPAVMWHGYVVAKERMALGNYADRKVIAGFCEDHADTMIDQESGFYGNYNSKRMGKCVALF